MTSDSSKPLAGRIALVTGATRGIGEAVALGLAKAGAHVIAVGRTQGALEALDDAILQATGERATLVPLDLREADGLDHLGAAIHKRWGKLDILVGAAGVLGPLTPVSHLEPKGWDMILSTNLTANWRLIRSMDPLLRASDAGRAVFFSSSVAKSRPAFWGAYAATKAALEALVDVYADEMENTTVRAFCVDPGAMRTKMRSAAFPGENPATVPAPETIAPFMVDLLRTDREAAKGVVRFKERGQESASIDA
ncbi:SDR family NAD(P)-dependent oxidoreductase [Caulobacter vibrioides]|uniref:Oxidoreductase, short-chain dehydrogenase/reductase family n=2 Tax=Caulobacter vibrioides TaxID=155892 RepID=Q9A7R4_CAUVC|nr:SDR family NAD(P)-dependent oxidoreductase [Caulobacter vibrioides]YP_002517101.1 short chain dehydrogenase [Caulobacter vibrioides NA1000]AAK23634.1 oxidoreductase, short-chain dehydrogenase/reductase family [Caulobacter vibrioides CB15]ACL95193.1 short chain dehydrogenase [Caulobacter vibrioides NA1000]ATC24663.1 oxidoreductase [Caulobacter vibrioides]ATC28538.1 oxidoreductase [Caulobacter vibrioides]AZH12804.1 SDR family NAD(P)-dependent oxidoreductase [Caulobacter vibrioides]